MTSEVLTEEPKEGSRISRRAILLAVALIALGVLLLLLGTPDLLAPAGEPDAGELRDLQNALKAIEGPALAVFGTLSILGLIAGGAMAVMGMQQGMRIMMTAGMAGGGVLLGKGLIL